MSKSYYFRDKRLLFSLVAILILLGISGIAIYHFLVPQTAEVDPDAVKVGVIDSGCTRDQSSSVVEYKTFTLIEHGYQTNDLTIYDSFGHGRYVCQLIIDNAPKAQLYSAKVANRQGQITYSGFITAIKYLIEEKNVDIINLSLGGTPIFDDEIADALMEYAGETLIVAASGNRGNDIDFSEGLIDWPALLPWVIGVGSEDENTDLTSYSAKGRSYIGNWVTEFTASGVVGRNIGTSFATPRITAKFAVLLKGYFDQNLNPTTEKLTGNLISTVNPTQFNTRTGWGKPSDKLEVNQSFRTYIEMGDEKDRLTRFSNESWSQSWKYFSSKGKPNLTDIITSGNATTAIQKIDVSHQNWGGMFNIDFIAPTDNGTYQLNLQFGNSNIGKYQFNVSDANATASVLFDHRHSINGLGHQFGEYFLAEEYLRDHNIVVEHVLEDIPKDLKNYDHVFITNFGQYHKDDLLFARDTDQIRFQQYIEYTKSGGNITYLLQSPDETYDKYNSHLQRLGKSQESEKIGSEKNPVTVSNFTDISIFDDIQSIPFEGSSVNATNSSIIEIGHYGKLVEGPLENDIKYLSIGIQGSIGNGNYTVLGSTSLLNNKLFVETNRKTGDFLLNLIGI